MLTRVQNNNSSTCLFNTWSFGLNTSPHIWSHYLQVYKGINTFYGVRSSRVTSISELVFSLPLGLGQLGALRDWDLCITLAWALYLICHNNAYYKCLSIKGKTTKGNIAWPRFIHQCTSFHALLSLLSLTLQFTYIILHVINFQPPKKQIRGQFNLVKFCQPWG